MIKKITYVDPPSGWKYGFPKPVPDPRPKDMESWFLSEGYPKELIDQGMLKYCRGWTEGVDENE